MHENPNLFIAKAKKGIYADTHLPLSNATTKILLDKVDDVKYIFYKGISSRLGIFLQVPP